MTRFTVKRFATLPNTARPGFTLIELLVVMALIAFLAAAVMVVAPGALDKDRSSAAVTQLEGALQISRARAMRDGFPRGIRLLPGPNSQATEYQYIEVPPLLVANDGGPLATPPYSTTGQTAPFVQLNYNVDATTGQVVAPPPPAPPTPQQPARTCTIEGLLPEHQSQIVTGTMLYLPTLGTWHRITGVNAPTPTGTTQSVVVTLEWYPDKELGSATLWRTYHFGLYRLPQPLLGEPAMQLPRSTSVDLALSSPNISGGADILFAPNGELLATPTIGGAGHVFLWVRDPDKVQSTDPNFFELGGEQMIVAIKAKSGGLGAAPVDWNWADPYSLARQKLTGH